MFATRTFVVSVFVSVVLFPTYCRAGQPDTYPASFAAPEPAVGPASRTTAAFSRLGIGANVSPLGIGGELSVNLNSHLNLRAGGSLFSHGIRFSSDGFDTTANLRLASARASLDVYPFRFGLRISPGVLVYNQNRVTARDTIAAGTSFTLNGDTFYSARVDPATGATPVSGSALLSLHATRPAFSITGGWGNPVAPNRRWSFPVEVGVALIGDPKLDVVLGGWACHDAAETECANISNPGDPIAVEVQNDLHAQVAKWKQNISPLRTYPILSAGVSFSFAVRGRGR